MTWWKGYGWAYNPFEHLDAARDPHLLDYLIWPGRGDLQAHETALVLAPPGGGKTAFRVALTQYALQTYGAIAPVVVVPESPPTRPDVLWEALAQAVARRTFWQALQFFGILPWHEDPDLVAFLARLWQNHLGWPWRVIVTWLHQHSWESLEYALGPSFSASPREIPGFLAILSGERYNSSPREHEPAGLLSIVHDALYVLREHLGAQHIWVLVDGLDGFPETQTLSAMEAVLAALLEQSSLWEGKHIHLKAFLPLAGSSEPQEILSGVDVAMVTLSWSKPMLIQMLRARVRAASRGLMDSLDPLAHPDLRPVEVRLVESLPKPLHLPRELIWMTKALLERASGQRLLPSHWRSLEESLTINKSVNL